MVLACGPAACRLAVWVERDRPPTHEHLLLLRLMLVLRLLWQLGRLANPPPVGGRVGHALMARALVGGAKSRSSTPAPWRITLRSMVEDQSDDLWGLAFLLIAVLGGLGIYAQVIGPAGHVLRTGTADVFGLARYGLPPAFAILGGYLIWRHERSEPARVAIGLGLALLAAAGLLAVVAGKDTLDQPLHSMGQSGGFLGAAEGVPLRAGLAGWGAALVLGAVLLISFLIITATPVRAIAGKLRLLGAGLARASRWCWSASVDLYRQRERLASAARHPTSGAPLPVLRGRCSRGRCAGARAGVAGASVPGAPHSSGAARPAPYDAFKAEAGLDAESEGEDDDATEPAVWGERRDRPEVTIAAVAQEGPGRTPLRSRSR